MVTTPIVFAMNPTNPEKLSAKSRDSGSEGERASPLFAPHMSPAAARPSLLTAVAALPVSAFVLVATDPSSAVANSAAASGAASDRPPPAAAAVPAKSAAAIWLEPAAAAATAVTGVAAAAASVAVWVHVVPVSTPLSEHDPAASS